MVGANDFKYFIDCSFYLFTYSRSSWSLRLILHWLGDCVNCDSVDSSSSFIVTDKQSTTPMGILLLLILLVIWNLRVAACLLKTAQWFTWVSLADHNAHSWRDLVTLVVVLVVQRGMAIICSHAVSEGDFWALHGQLLHLLSNALPLHALVERLLSWGYRGATIWIGLMGLMHRFDGHSRI